MQNENCDDANSEYESLKASMQELANRARDLLRRIPQEGKGRVRVGRLKDLISLADKL